MQIAPAGIRIIHQDAMTCRVDGSVRPLNDKDAGFLPILVYLNPAEYADAAAVRTVMDFTREHRREANALTIQAHCLGINQEFQQEAVLESLYQHHKQDIPFFRDSENVYDAIAKHTDFPTEDRGQSAMAALDCLRTSRAPIWNGLAPENRAPLERFEETHREDITRRLTQKWQALTRDWGDTPAETELRARLARSADNHADFFKACETYADAKFNALQPDRVAQEARIKAERGWAERAKGVIADGITHAQNHNSLKPLAGADKFLAGRPPKGVVGDTLRQLDKINSNVAGQCAGALIACAHLVNEAKLGLTRHPPTARNADRHEERLHACLMQLPESAAILRHKGVDIIIADDESRIATAGSIDTNRAVGGYSAYALNRIFLRHDSITPKQLDIVREETTHFVAAHLDCFDAQPAFVLAAHRDYDRPESQTVLKATGFGAKLNYTENQKPKELLATLENLKIRYRSQGQSEAQATQRLAEEFPNSAPWLETFEQVRREAVNRITPPAQMRASGPPRAASAPGMPQKSAPVQR